MIERVEYEEYRIVEGFEMYEVSNLGKVRNVHTKRVLRTYQNKSGVYVSLYDVIQFNRLVKRLVAHAFIGNTNNRIVNNIDGDPTNNRVTNIAIRGKIGDSRIKKRSNTDESSIDETSH